MCELDEVQAVKYIEIYHRNRNEGHIMDEISHDTPNENL